MGSWHILPWVVVFAEPVPCDRDEFQCLNYQCVPGSFYCDGDIDCLDGSDEPRSCREYPIDYLDGSDEPRSCREYPIDYLDGSDEPRSCREYPIDYLDGSDEPRSCRE